MNGEGAVERDVRDATAAAVSAGRAPSSTPNDAARLVRSPLDAALWRGAGRVARETLDRYVRSWWSALDAVLVLALFAFVFGRPFDAAYFATSGFLPLAVLGAVSGSALARGVVPPSGWEAQAFEEGAGSCAAGLLVAVVVVRVAAAALLALLAIVFGRFSDASPWAVLVATVGLALGGALAAGVMVALATPGAPRVTPLVALGALAVSLAAFGMDGTLGAAVWVCRLPLLPFAAAYALGVGERAWAWPAALALAVGALGGLGWLASHWLGVHLEAGQAPDM